MNSNNSHQEFEPFLENYTQGKNQICYRILLADTQTAVAAMLKLSEQDSYSCLLESVEGGKVRGRFSIIAIEPDLIGAVEITKLRQTETQQKNLMISYLYIHKTRSKIYVQF